MYKLFFIMASVLLGAAPVLGNVLLFEARIDYDVGNHPSSITGADLDNDGDHDLIVNVSASAGISVLLNNGGGTYAAPVGYGDGYNTIFLIKADYDGDGSIDLALGNPLDSITILLNNGDGTFIPGSVTSIVGASKGLSPDLDGDGDADMVIVRPFNKFIGIYLNNGVGEFSFLGFYDLGVDGISLFGEDFDGDGDTDLAAIGNSNDIYILLNNGDATFAASVNYTVASDPRRITGADFDDDGDCDLVISYTGSVSILLNNGDGSFAAGINYEPWSSSKLFIADFDGDNDLDLAGGENVSINLLLNNGDGTFADPVTIIVPDLISSNLSIDYIEDINGDTDFDLVLTGIYSNNNISLMFNHGDRTFPQPYSYMDDWYLFGPSVFGSDFDGDGDLDLAGTYPGHGGYHGWWIPGNIVISINNGDGTYLSNPNLFYDLNDPADVFGSDFDGDGDCDLAVLDNISGWPVESSVKILLNNGEGFFTPATEYDVGSSSSFFGADFDKDGDCDLALTIEYEGSDSVSILLNNGDGTFVTVNSYSVGDAPNSVLCVDLDDDTYPDLVVTYYGISDTDSGGVSVLLNKGDGTFEAEVSYNAGVNPISVFAADFDGDFINDLAVANVNSPYIPWEDWNSVSLLSGNGDGTFAQAVEYSMGNYLLGSVFGADFDADGDCDLAVPIVGYDFYYDLNRVKALSILINDGFGNFSTDVTYALATEDQPSASGGGTFVGDVDDDGDIDLAVGTYILINTTNGGSCTDDSDCDGLTNTLDNCPHMDNPNQADTDEDGAGDVCDVCPGYDDFADYDEDAFPDSCDNCPAVYNPSQDDSDADSDGVPDACDLCPGNDDNLDSDGDGIPDGCDYICGDANGDRDVNVGDAVYIINYVFKSGNPPDPLCAGGANDDEAVNVGDAVYLINYIFKNGNPPAVSCCP